ncbi:MAG: hypothetical protein K2L93_00975, partial [Muribaculaceae bacterium]|nr:hypothetical protein [Muribaculaceae bacterium]
MANNYRIRMLYRSTNHISPSVTLRQAIKEGVAPDGGGYEPESIRRLPAALFRNLPEMSIQEIAYVVGNTLFSDDVTSMVVKDLVGKIFTFDMPVEWDKDSPGHITVDLTQGPTCSFKDLGAKALVEMLQYLSTTYNEPVPSLLVASSGPTARAIVNAVSYYDNMQLILLVTQELASGSDPYPRNANAPILGQGHLVRVKGSVEQCRRLVSEAFDDTQLRSLMAITSANSLNVGSYLAEVVIHFHTYARITAMGLDPDRVVIVLPAQFPSLSRAAKVAQLMGLPMRRFILGTPDVVPAAGDTVISLLTDKSALPAYQLKQTVISPT